MPASLAYADNRLHADLPLGASRPANLIFGPSQVSRRARAALACGDGGLSRIALRHHGHSRPEDRDVGAGFAASINEDRLARVVELPWFRGGAFQLGPPDAAPCAGSGDVVGRRRTRYRIIAQARKAADGADTNKSSSSEPNVAQPRSPLASGAGLGAGTVTVGRCHRRVDRSRRPRRSHAAPNGPSASGPFGDVRRRAWLERAPFYGPALAWVDRRASG